MSHSQGQSNYNAHSATTQSRYIQAIRDGPARYPDHILVTHPEFKRDRPSPYMLFYYDITAPNPILLENDVIRDAKLRKRQKKQKYPVNQKFWREDPPMDYQSTRSSPSTTSYSSYPTQRHGSAIDTHSTPGKSDISGASIKNNLITSPPRGRRGRTLTSSSSSLSSYSYSSSYTYESYSSSSSSSVVRKKGKKKPHVSRTNRDSFSSSVTSSSKSYTSSVSSSSMVGGGYLQTHDRDATKMIHPDLRRHSKRDLKYAKRELFFDAHELPDNDKFPGTIYSHLPQYSTSYKNFPNVAFDVINPRNYREFFNERNAPGFFTVHRPTNQKVQGRRTEKASGFRPDGKH